MKNQRRKHTAEFKAHIALEAIRGIDTLNEIAAKYKGASRTGRQRRNVIFSTHHTNTFFRYCPV